ncbi:MAG: hypothetical protein AAF141_16290 [Pseudomonadota bacterium]
MERFLFRSASAGTLPLLAQLVEKDPGHLLPLVFTDETALKLRKADADVQKKVFHGFITAVKRIEKFYGNIEEKTKPEGGALYVRVVSVTSVIDMTGALGRDASNYGFYATDCEVALDNLQNKLDEVERTGADLAACLDDALGGGGGGGLMPGQSQTVDIPDGHSCSAHAGSFNVAMHEYDLAVRDVNLLCDFDVT